MLQMSNLEPILSSGHFFIHPVVYLPCTDYTLKRFMLSNIHNCSTYSTHKVYHQSVKLIVILGGIALFLSDFLVVAASSCQCDS